MIGHLGHFLLDFLAQIWTQGCLRHILGAILVILKYVNFFTIPGPFEYVHTCINMIISCKWLLPWHREIVGNPIMTSSLTCACMCMHACVHVHMYGAPPNTLTESHSHPPTPTPQGGRPSKSVKSQ